MKRWPHRVSFMTREEIMGAIADEEWQIFRRSLKGLPTTQKLERLSTYLRVQERVHGEARVVHIRVDNYINALLRGGQLVRRSDDQIVVNR